MRVVQLTGQWVMLELSIFTAGKILTMMLYTMKFTHLCTLLVVDLIKINVLYYHAVMTQLDMGSILQTVTTKLKNIDFMTKKYKLSRLLKQAVRTISLNASNQISNILDNVVTVSRDGQVLIVRFQFAGRIACMERVFTQTGACAMKDG